MRIFGMGMTEFIVIALVVVLLIFGPKNLPKLGSAIGSAMKNLREGMDGKDKGKGEEDSGAEEKADGADEQPVQAEVEDIDEGETVGAVDKS